MNLGHAYKTNFWYILGVFSKFSNKHPINFIGEFPPPPGPEHSDFYFSHTTGSNARLTATTSPLLQTKQTLKCTSCNVRKITQWKCQQKIEHQLEFFGQVDGKRSVMADTTKTTAHQRSPDPFPGPSGV